MKTLGDGVDEVGRLEVLTLSVSGRFEVLGLIRAEGGIGIV